MPSGQPKALVPPDLQGQRANLIALQNYLLGFGGPPGSQGGGQQPGMAPMGFGGMGGAGFNLAHLIQQHVAGNGQPNAYIGQGGGGNDPLYRLQLFFGQ